MTEKQLPFVHMKEDKMIFIIIINISLKRYQNITYRDRTLCDFTDFTPVIL